MSGDIMDDFKIICSFCGKMNQGYLYTKERDHRDYQVFHCKSCGNEQVVGKGCVI